MSVTAVVTIGVIAAGLWGYQVVFPANEGELSEQEKRQLDEREAETKNDGVVRDQAKQALEKGDLTAAANIYKDAIATEQEAAKKVRLYVDLSGVLYAEGKYKEAFAAAKEAEAASSDQFISADWLSRLYEDQRDYVNAAKYYRRAAEHANSPLNITGLDRAYYEGEAARVDELAKGKRS